MPKRTRATEAAAAAAASAQECVIPRTAPAYVPKRRKRRIPLRLWRRRRSNGRSPLLLFGFFYDHNNRFVCCDPVLLQPLNCNQVCGNLKRPFSVIFQPRWQLVDGRGKGKAEKSELAFTTKFWFIEFVAVDFRLPFGIAWIECT